MSWYVAYTEPSREGLARDELRHRGLEVYCPFKEVRQRMKIRAVGGRFSPAKPRFKIVTRQQPFFGRYIFVNCAGASGVVCVLGTRGISGLVSFGGDPVSVREKDMERLMGRADTRGCVGQEDRAAFAGAVGDTFRVGAGPFLGFLGVLRAIGAAEDAGVVEGEIVLFGRATKIVVPVEDVGLVKLNSSRLAA